MSENMRRRERLVSELMRRRERLVEAAKAMAENPSVEASEALGKAMADVLADMTGKECMVVALYREDEGALH